jgi:nucleoid-associated protein YgaU
VELERTQSVTVQDGDCLWTIASEILNSDDAPRIDAYWRAIFRINRAVVGRDPDHLVPGQVLKLPRKATG